MTTTEIKLKYFASLKEKAGKSNETIATSAQTCQELYKSLQEQYQFPLTEKQIKVSVNNQFTELNTQLKSGDEVVFIPPVAGG